MCELMEERKDKQQCCQNNNDNNPEIDLIYNQASDNNLEDNLSKTSNHEFKELESLLEDSDFYLSKMQEKQEPLQTNVTIVDGVNDNIDQGMADRWASNQDDIRPTVIEDDSDQSAEITY